jgi:hypothetical protein
LVLVLVLVLAPASTPYPSFCHFCIGPLPNGV